jgi:hypothetical protein
LHLVPILQGSGIGLTTAAWIAGLIGVFAIVGRLSTGLLLDIFPTRPLAIVVFLLPIAVSLLMWNVHASVPVAVAR